VADEEVGIKAFSSVDSLADFIKEKSAA